MVGAFPYIGCKSSLLSKEGIRYEGTLYTIDPNDFKIALSNGELFTRRMLLSTPYAVRCFGTEGRRKKDNLPEVEPAPEIFEYIIFKGNGIADLTVCEQPQPAQPATLQDPAIVSVRTAEPSVSCWHQPLMLSLTHATCTRRTHPANKSNQGFRSLSLLHNPASGRVFVWRRRNGGDVQLTCIFHESTSSSTCNDNRAASTPVSSGFTIKHPR